jgi:hypothetical protein
MKARLTVFLLALILFGCAQLGVQPAKSLDEQLAYGYASLATVRTTAANALNTHVISVSDAQHVQTIADECRSALDGGRLAMSTGDTQTALGRIQLANNILLQLAAYLQQAKGSK